MKLLTTGATGKLGSKVVEALLELIPARDLVVSVRNPEKADDLREKGVEVRRGDFDHPETLAEAFTGIDRLLIISTDGDNETRIQQHKNAVEAAKNQGVKFIAYTSIANASESSNLMAPPHKATEAAIIATGIPYAFLRNNWYLENEISSIQGVMAGADWVTSAGDGKVGWALQKDYAEAAARVLTGEGHAFRVYELSGPLLTQEAFATHLGHVLNKDVTVNQVSDETYAEIMRNVGVPEAALPIVVGIQQSIRAGTLAVESNDFEMVLGRPVTPTEEAIRHVVDQLS